METTETSTSAPVDVWVNSADHKRLGRTWIVVSILALLVGGATGGILGAEKAATGFDLLDAGNFLQIYSVHATSAVFGFLVPAWIGIALVMVPLQVGARNVALPKAAAFATWLFVVGTVIVEAAYLDGGGPGTNQGDASELWALGLGLVVVALVTASVCLVTTILGARLPGMSMTEVAPFTWSVLVAASLWLLTLPIVGGTLILGWMEVHYGAGVLPGLEPLLGPLTWFFGPPQVYLLAIPAVGVAAEAVAIATGRHAHPWPGLVIGLGGLGALGFGALAHPLAGADTSTGLIWHVIGLAVVAPLLISVGGLADIVRPDHDRIKVNAALVFSIGAVFALVAGVGAGMILIADRSGVQGSTWISGQTHYIGLGAATLGIAAALHLWSPKIFGGLLNNLVGMVSFALLFVGTNVLVLTDLVAGADNMPVAAPNYADEGSWETLSQLGGFGGALAIGGAVLLVLNVIGVVSTRRTPVADDPWEAPGGLEWRTASPPVDGNFESVPELTDAAR